MAPLALLAQNKRIPATYLARAGLRRRQPLEVLLQLAALVQAPHLLDAADVPPLDENPRQSQIRFRFTENFMQLVHETYGSFGGK